MAEESKIDEIQCDDCEREEEFLLLMQQVDEGKYDGDGPSNVSPVEQ